MKSITLMVLACLVSSPLIAQTLPDEINAAPYDSRYQTLSGTVNSTSTQLSSVQSSLADARRFIKEMNDHIASLNQRIANSQGQINEHRQAIPQLQQDITAIRNEQGRTNHIFQQKQGELNQLENRIQHQVRVLRPLEELLNRKEARLRDLRAEVANLNRIERDISSRLEKSQAEAKSVDGRIEEEKAEQRKLKAEMANTAGAIAAAEAVVRLAENDLVQAQKEIEQEKGKLAALSVRVETARQEMITLGQSEGDPVRFEAARVKFVQLNEMKQKAEANIPVLEAALPALSQKIAKAKEGVEVARRGDPTLPAKIAASEGREATYIAKRNALTQEINKGQAEFYAHHKVTEQKENILAREQQDMRQDEMAVARERNFLENLSKSAEQTKAEMSGLAARSQDLERQAQVRDTEMRNRIAALPQIDASIRKDQQEISAGQEQIQKVSADENRLEASESSLQGQLARQVADRDEAQAQRNQRQSLYNRYLEEAADLGESQSQAGSALGDKEGAKAALALGKQNGSSVGRELGVAEAKLWGNTRGELQGYDMGYREGLASAADINQAQAEGEARGIKDADSYANSNIKPGFFEEELLNLFKQPLTKAQVKNIQMLKDLRTIVKANGVAEPISQEEITASKRLVTPLDSIIVTNGKDLKMVQDKAAKLSDAGQVFSAPNQIPYGSVNCAQVYKNVAAFKAACDSAYRRNFSGLFVEAARESFTADYRDIFLASLEENNLQIREASYPLELANAVKISRAEGLRVGKVEIYKSTFDRVYKAAYADQLPKATSRVRIEAQTELANLRQTKALLTLSKSELKFGELRAGEEVSLLTEIKNVSDVKFNGPVVIRITTAQNAELSTNQIVLNSAEARSLTAAPELKFKVDGRAQSRDRLVIRGVVDLPGDLYKPARQEAFELVQIIEANLTNTMVKEFDATPSIKELFGRKKNTLKVKVAATGEDLPEGFTLSLNGVGENAALVNIVDKDLETGALQENVAKDIKFTYTFPDTAKKKTITMELVLSFGGKVLKKEVITVNPK